MTLDEELRRGHSAEVLLNDPLIVEAFETIEREIIEKWHSTPVRDADAREKLWLMNQMLRRVKRHLESTVETGKMAKLTLKERAGRNTSPL